MTSRTAQVTQPDDAQTVRAGLTWPRQRFIIEAITVIGGYVLYELVRAWAPANPIPAFRHAARIIHLEEITHLDIEVPMNRVFSTHALLGSFSGYWYAILHFLVTPIVLLWLWRWRPSVFPRLRSTLVLMSTSSLARVLAVPRRSATVRRAGHDRHPGAAQGRRVGSRARHLGLRRPVRRGAEPARRLGRVVRAGRRLRLRHSLGATWHGCIPPRPPWW